MPDEPKPAPQPEQSGGGLWAVGWKVLGLSAEQQRGLVALGLTGFLMWFVYDGVSEGRRAENERAAMVVRAFESEGEKGRNAVGDIGKLTVASHQKLATELGKLEARLQDMNATHQKLTQQVAELSAAVADLRKKLPPHEVNFAPMPREKGEPAGG